ELNPLLTQGRAGRLDVVGNQAQQALVADRHAGHRFEVDTVASQGVGHAGDFTGPMGQGDCEVAHGKLLSDRIGGLSPEWSAEPGVLWSWTCPVGELQPTVLALRRKPSRLVTSRQEEGKTIIRAWPPRAP